MQALTVGDFAPWVTVPSTAGPRHHIDRVAGQRTVLFFFGSGSDPQIQPLLEEFLSRREQLAAQQVTLLGVSVDPNDEGLAPQIQPIDHVELLWDFDGDLSIEFGVCRLEAGGVAYDPTTFVLDENRRVLGVFPVDRQVPHVAQVMQLVSQLPPPQSQTVSRHAPVLIVPQVLEPEFCQYLIQLYEADGGRESGFMRQVDDKTVEVVEAQYKRRRDLLLTDPQIIDAVNQRIWRRVKPEIEKAFQFSITNFERYLVACYEEATQGFFKAHRDNATTGTLHRRFAMTLNLNSGYEGGYLWFPEYGADRYRPAAGEAVIFSCSLLHEATPVTQGRRFTLLSFFFGDQDVSVRQQNQQSLVLRQTPHVQTSTIATSPAAAKPSGFQTSSPPSKKKKR